jgi:transcriptional regulator with XRE-family HTH domain
VHERDMMLPTAMPIPAHMVKTSQNETKDWLAHVASQTGLSFQQIAERANISPTTITRFIGDKSGQRTITSGTLEKISQAVGFKPLEYKQSPFGAFAEAEAIPYESMDAPNDWLDKTVRDMCTAVQSRDPWVLRTNALDLLGYNKGDTVIVDLSIQPNDGDIVCAQIYDWQRETAETVFRLYRKPWLMTHSSMMAPLQPRLVDDENVAIKGVVEAVLRPRTRH